jgi:pyruvate ferredoxin oxidoreductase delta subunit
MKRSQLKQFVRPKHIREYPTGPCFEAGHLVSENASWRTELPVIDAARCKKCQRCYILCPEGTIIIENGRYSIDKSFCKGCGICAKECPFNAIAMVKEVRE